MVSFRAQSLWIWPILCVGCVEGANVETLVDELRVVAIALEPPEAAPGESFTAALHVGSPSLSEISVAAWTCAGFGGDCLEQLVSRAAIAEGSAPLFEVELQAPYEAAALLVEAEEFPISVWAMACEQGVCSVLDDIAEGVADADVLADPTLALEALPLSGVSVARKSLWVSNRDEEERRENPAILPQFDSPLQGRVAEPLELAFDISGGATEGYGYATGGGFEMSEYTVLDGVLSMSWYAPEAAGEYTIWVIAQSDEGGSAVWSSTVQVQ